VYMKSCIEKNSSTSIESARLSRMKISSNFITLINPIKF
jgi:hypothetical protein